jgi:hypothetical protein
MSRERSQRVSLRPHRLEDEQSEELDRREMKQMEQRFSRSLLIDVDDERKSDDEESGGDWEVDDEEAEVEEVLEEKNVSTDWSKDYTPITANAFVPSLPSQSIPPSADSPLDFFLLMLPLEFIRHIVKQTNRHADNEKKNRPPPAEAGRWKIGPGLRRIGLQQLSRRCVPSWAVL